MEKTQLLFVLKMFVCLTILAIWIKQIRADEVVSTSGEQVEEELTESLKEYKPTESDIEFAGDVSSKGLDMTLDYINELLTQNKIYGEGYSDIRGKARRSDLFVFVSISMPLTTLREYAKEAVKYNAVLVFKGLAKEGVEGWKELAKTVEDIDIGKEDVGVQIDEEAFEEFEVRAVPTIVLRKGDFCLKNMSCKTTFDKVSGNIGIKAALEQFANEGEMQIRAQELIDDN